MLKPGYYRHAKLPNIPGAGQALGAATGKSKNAQNCITFYDDLSRILMKGPPTVDYGHRLRLDDSNRDSGSMQVSSLGSSGQNTGGQQGSGSRHPSGGGPPSSSVGQQSSRGQQYSGSRPPSSGAPPSNSEKPPSSAGKQSSEKRPSTAGAGGSKASTGQPLGRKLT